MGERLSHGTPEQDLDPAEPGRGRAGEVLAVALRLGLTSFGGPVAHLGYFRREYVERRRWLNEPSYAATVALGQALPGPASSQVGIAIGTARAGLPGGLAAWLGFTLPSALVMGALGLGVASGTLVGGAWVDGLKIAAVAVVAHAVWSMARSLAPDLPRAAVALVAAVLALAVATPATQVLLIVAGALVGVVVLARLGAVPAAPPGTAEGPVAPVAGPVPRRVALAALGLFAALLAGLPLLAATTADPAIAFVDAFYRAGALVFGGGHVVLPLLEAAVVAPGWVSQDAFLAGYGAAQALPGPARPSPRPRSSCRARSSSSARCRSGPRCGRDAARAPRWPGSTPPSSGSWPPRSSTRSPGRRSAGRPTSWSPRRASGPS